MNRIQQPENVPGNRWPSRSLKRYGSLLGGSGFPVGEQGFSQEEMEIPFFKVKDLAAPYNLSTTDNYVSRETAARLGATIFPESTIVFAKVGAALLLNRFRVLECEACLDNNMMAFQVNKPNEVSFFLHLLNDTDLSCNFNQGPVPSVNTRQIGSTTVTVPRPEDQRRIAAYLDASCAAIDAAVAAKRRQLETLDAVRETLIESAVTKGIQPSTKTRKVNEDWIGKIPAHWEVCRIKRIVSQVDYGISEATVKEGQFPVLKMAHIQRGKLVFSNLDFVDDVAEALLLERGDLLYNRTNSPDQVGKAAIFRGAKEDKLTFASYLVRLRTNHRADPYFLNYLINSHGFLAFARKLAIPSVQQSNLNSTRYCRMWIPLPPPKEQLEIAAFLDTKLAELERVVTVISEQIETLIAYRKSLIHECVTGQRRVTEADLKHTQSDA